MLPKLSIAKYLIIFLSILLIYQVVETNAKTIHTKSFYKSIKHDVTGDRKIDKIELKGKKSKKNKKWTKALKLTVKSNHKVISIPLKSGSHPKLVIADFNQDGIKDILVTIHKQHEQLFSKIYSFKGEQVTQMNLPQQVPMTAQFQDGYKAEINVKGPIPVKVDISRHRKFYEKVGIYHHGKLNEATELIVNPFSEFTAYSLCGHGTGVIGKQSVNGVDENDPIAIILTSWSYTEGQWKLQKVKVKPV